MPARPCAGVISSSQRGAREMQTIWKTVLKPIDVQEIEVPVGAEMLCAREQYEEIAIWYRCDDQAPKGRRTITIIGTGNPAPGFYTGRYLGTAALRDGQLMFHVFEKAP